jgi:DNA-binding FadR family transcriptional regulator
MGLDRRPRPPKKEEPTGDSGKGPRKGPKSAAGQESGLFVPLPPRRTYIEVERQIRSLIYSGNLKPGDRLPSEKELAAQIGVGRLSVREALRMLEQAGFITVRQGVRGGSYINELDSKVTVESMFNLVWQGDVRVEDVVEARCEVEALVLKRAFGRITEDRLLALESSVRELEMLVAEGREEEYPVHPLLTEFHVLLAEFTENPIFPIILKVLIGVALRVMVPATVSLKRLEKHASSHRAIFDALKEGRLDDASEAMDRHLREVGNRKPGTKA